MRGLRNIAFGLAFLGLAACQTNDLKQPPVPLGAGFGMGFTVAITDNMQKSPISREASPEQVEKAMVKAMEDRFGRYNGTRLFNFGISVDGYSLAQPGVPILVSPPSVMIVTVSVFEDATAKKLNPEGTQLTIIEKGSPETFIGSGWTQSKERQLEILTYNVAKRIEGYLLENPAWLGMTAEEAKAALAQSYGGAAPAESPKAE